MKFFIALLISIIPINLIRVHLYNFAFGYQIRNSKVGLLTIILVNNFKSSNCTIGHLNLFTGPMMVELGHNSQIGYRNRFNCGQWTEQNTDYAKKITIGSEALITNGHHFDVAGKIIIGDSTVIAGIGSQFWTHGNGVMDKDIIIGNNCYLGTASIFCPGCSVNNNSVVGAGTIVTKKFSETNVLIIGSAGSIKKKLNVV